MMFIMGLRLKEKYWWVGGESNSFGQGRQAGRRVKICNASLDPELVPSSLCMSSFVQNEVREPSPILLRESMRSTRLSDWYHQVPYQKAFFLIQARMRTWSPALTFARLWQWWKKYGKHPGLCLVAQGLSRDTMRIVMLMIMMCSEIVSCTLHGSELSYWIVFNFGCHL